jgi:glutamate:GABA antiporter
VLTTLVLLAAISGSAIHEAFIALIDMSMILSFVPLLYMFAALPTLRRRSAGSPAGVIRIPGGSVVCWLVAGSGMAVTLLGAIVAMVPPTNSANRSLFALKVVGGCGIMIAVGLIFYFRGRQAAGHAARVGGQPDLSNHAARLACTCRRNSSGLEISRKASFVPPTPDTVMVP